jgi:glutathione S-transferase
MVEPPIRLYGIPLSHPVGAVRGMLDYKGLAYRYVELLAGLHPPSLWALGFRRSTVPAVRLADGRRVQGSLAIARALEGVAPRPALYPADPDARTATEEAERWGERVLQPIPRRLIRWGLRHRFGQRRWWFDKAAPLPLPALAAALSTPITILFVRQSGATADRVRHDLAGLPGILDEVDRLVEASVIGRSECSAADFQIGCSVRVLLAMQDVGRLVAGRPAEELARRVMPECPAVPAALPGAWLPPSG